jgi:hypothetical protein
MIWRFKTARYVVEHHEGPMLQFVVVSYRDISDFSGVLGVAVDAVGFKTRQQLVREALDKASDMLIVRNLKLLFG